MTLFNAVVLLTLVSGLSGLAAMLYVACFKLSSESIDSPKPVVRWIYRYLFFSFWFLVSFMAAGPATTWQILKVPAVAAFTREHAWLLAVLTAIPALLLYYLHRKYMIWCDPVKIGARKSAAAYYRNGR